MSQSGVISVKSSKPIIGFVVLLVIAFGLTSSVALGQGYWSNPQPFTPANSSSADWTIAFSPDYLSFYISTERDGYFGNSEIYRAERPDLSSPWSTPAPEDTCLGKQGCMVANSAAPTMIPGVVFAGGLDGYIRAYSTKDGSIVWQYDTTGEYESVSGISGRGWPWHRWPPASHENPIPLDVE